MERPPHAPEWVKVLTCRENPDAWARARTEGRFDSVWPEYNNHGNHTNVYFKVLLPEFADLQVLLVDTRSDQAVARGRSIPFRWGGSLDDLPQGMDAAGLRAVEEGAAKANTLCALAAEVAPEYQGQNLSRTVIQAMAAAARGRGLGDLVAPVRPSWKDRYPITPIVQYATWRRADGLPFDPWLRVHARLGATILRSAPRSLLISAPVEDWESWVGMAFPEDGDYVFPSGLAPVTVKDGVGEYFEPNVWMLHHL